MKQHRFKVGQKVNVVPGTEIGAPAGEYGIVRLVVPVEASEPHYEVQASQSGRNWIVREGELARQ